MMDTAILWSKESYCKKRKVGSVLSKDGRILATGYNGTISGFDNKCEDYLLLETVCVNSEAYLKYLKFPNRFIAVQSKIEQQVTMTCDQWVDIYDTSVLVTSEFTIHAEQNILSFCSKNGIPTNDTVLYVTTAPCKQCSKLIAQSGISRVVYKDDYKDLEGIEFLRKCNIEVLKFS